MKRLVALLVMGLFAGTSIMALAATPQQEKMKQCNAEAGKKDLKGDERKAFMKDCLSAKGSQPAAAALTSQQEKMKTCNKQAGEKKLAGEERKQFMKSCLSS